MSGRNKRIVIVGATSVIAEQCARLWVAVAPVDLILVGRDKAKTERVAAELQVRSPLSDVRVLVTEFVAPCAIRELVDEIITQGEVHVVLVAHCSLPDQSVCQKDLAACNDTLVLNGISPVLFAEAFVGEMQKNNQGTLAFIGSVAGDRGRKSNYVYGAAKVLITRCAQGLQHRFAGTGVKVVLIKPGPTETPMTAGLRKQGARLADAAAVARLIVKGINRGAQVVYAPAKWWWIMIVIRHLPSSIFNKLNI